MRWHMPRAEHASKLLHGDPRPPMDHPMTVGADPREVLKTSLNRAGHVERVSLMDFDVSGASRAIYLLEVEAADLARKPVSYREQ